MKGLAIIFTISLLFATEIDIGAEDSGVVEQDVYSGRMVIDGEMAFRIISGRRFNPPKVGEKAPNFTVVKGDSKEVVSLTDLHSEKPVVLFFGSYGCDVLRDGVDDLARLYRRFDSRFAFAMIYIREAHALNGFGAEMARAEDPATLDERIALAGKCRAAMDIPFPVYVDSLDDRAATRWGAWPIRLFVVGRDGTVFYTSDTGPWGFNPGGGYKPIPIEGLEPRPEEFSKVTLEEFLENFK